MKCSDEMQAQCPPPYLATPCCSLPAPLCTAVHTHKHAATPTSPLHLPCMPRHTHAANFILRQANTKDTSTTNNNIVESVCPGNEYSLVVRVCGLCSRRRQQLVLALRRNANASSVQLPASKQKPLSPHCCKPLITAQVEYGSQDQLRHSFLTTTPQASFLDANDATCTQQRWTEQTNTAQSTTLAVKCGATGACFS